jgi:CPA1 family monovalent cation:H+ antiporter
VSLATALALPLVVRGGAPFPQRNVILFITFTVIFVTLILQGLTLPWLVRRLGVQEDPAALVAEEQVLRLTLASDALAHLDQQLAAEAPGSPDPSLLTMREVVRRQMQRLHGTLAANEATPLSPPDPAETEAAEHFELLLRRRLELTEHQRRLLVELHRQDAYSEEAIRQVELELDRFEIALDTQLATVQQADEQEKEQVGGV